ncbi:MAG: hypothetical protein KF699_08510 [Phycisphaeraceae bacterium]|nr:hypothetical protein [Phycisphaeraceae bacterium]MBX3406154.1 hypothetical protein [Phycisphaeraceae bacterium]
MEAPTETVQALETVREPLACMSCKYDLRGLPIGGVCPECATSIRTSIAAAVGKIERPWPGWLKALRTTYVTSWIVTWLSPWLAPEVFRALGLWKRGMGSALMDQIMIQWMFTLFVGIVFWFTLHQRRSRYRFAALGSLIVYFLASGIFMPAYGG